MTKVLGLFKEDETAASATITLQEAGYTNENFDILTGSPYPEGYAKTVEAPDHSWFPAFGVTSAGIRFRSQHSFVGLCRRHLRGGVARYNLCSLLCHRRGPLRGVGGGHSDDIDALVVWMAGVYS